MTLIVSNLPLLDRFRPLAYVLAALAIVAFAYSEPNPPLCVVGVIAPVLSWALVERAGGKPLPRWLINIGVLAASAGLFYELVIAPHDSRDSRQLNLLETLGHFMCFILACKLFERKASRDYAQILTLSLLIMVSGAVLATASLVFACLLALYLTLGLYVIFLFHLRSESECAQAGGGQPAKTSLSAEIPALIRKDIRRVAVWSAFLLMAVSIIVFLLFPRSSSQQYFTTWAGAPSSTGFSDHVRMLDHVNLQQSDAVVMEVKLEQNGINIGSEYFEPYFRGMVLDTYEPGSRQWVRSLGNAAFPESEFSLGGEAPVKLLSPERSAQYTSLGLINQSYSLHTTTGTALFALSPPVAFASPELHTVTFSPRDFLLSSRTLPAQGAHYSVVSAVIYTPALFHDPVLVTPGDLGAYRSYDRTGEHVPRNSVPAEIMNLARSIAQDLLPPADEPLPPKMIRPITDRFQKYLQGNYAYSMNFQTVDRRLDPTADFLLNRKQTGGHCEYFASAMVMLCRAVGINARMATGYHGSEFNSLGGFYVVRQKDAHAWVEVCVPEHGWTIFDPSPGDGGELNTSSITRWFRDMSEILEKVWVSTVVAFDNTSRSYIFSSMAEFFRSAAAATKNFLVDWATGYRDLVAGPDSHLITRMEFLGATATLLALLLWLGWRWQRQRTSELSQILKTVDRKTQRQLANDLAFYDDLMRLLKRTGHRKLPHQTPLEYVNSLSPSLHGALADVRWLIDIFYDIRFGALRLNLPLRERISSALQRIRQEIPRNMV